MKKIGIFLAVCANVFNIYAQNKINGHEYVDLGLSVKWATCNVGANTPEEYGDYYAWGETSTKSEYTRNNSRTFGKDIMDEETIIFEDIVMFASKDVDISGNANYDAARANWGGSWRMPTIAEMEELEIKCAWKWTKQNGVNGYKVTGPNGNSIFLPAAGLCDGEMPRYYGEEGYYWSSTLKAGISEACCIEFDSIHLNVDDGLTEILYMGLSVRPVTE